MLYFSVCLMLAFAVDWLQVSYYKIYSCIPWFSSLRILFQSFGNASCRLLGFAFCFVIQVTFYWSWFPTTLCTFIPYLTFFWLGICREGVNHSMRWPSGRRVSYGYRMCGEKFLRHVRVPVCIQTQSQAEEQTVDPLILSVDKYSGIEIHSSWML